MLNSTIDSLNYTINSCKALLNKEPIFKQKEEELKEDIKSKEEYLAFLKGAKEKYTIVVNELYEESIGALKETLNTALTAPEPIRQTGLLNRLSETSNKKVKIMDPTIPFEYFGEYDMEGITPYTFME